MQKCFVVEEVAVSPGFRDRALAFRGSSTADTGPPSVTAEVNGNVQAGAVCRQNHRGDVPGVDQAERGGVNVLMIHAVSLAVGELPFPWSWLMVLKKRSCLNSKHLTCRSCLFKICHM
jgi:hypothetical protein